MDGDLTLADVLEVAQLGAQVAAWAGSEMRTAFFGRGFVAGVADAWVVLGPRYTARYTY